MEVERAVKRRKRERRRAMILVGALDLFALAWGVVAALSARGSSMETGRETVSRIALVALPMALAASISLVAHRRYRRDLSRLEALRGVSPIPCILEDILLIGRKRPWYRADVRRWTHVPYPILRSLEDSKLYAALGSDAVCTGYRYTVTDDGRTLSCALLKSDGVSVVKIGDPVRMYPAKIPTPLKMDRERQTVRVDGQVCRFRCVTGQVDRYALRGLTGFRGMVDVNDAGEAYVGDLDDLIDEYTVPRRSGRHRRDS